MECLFVLAWKNFSTWRVLIVMYHILLPPNLRKLKRDTNELLMCWKRSIVNQRRYLTFCNLISIRSVKKLLCLVILYMLFFSIKLQGPILMTWFKVSADRKVVYAYSWGRDSYTLTVDYLRMIVTSTKKFHNLYYFSWAFIVNFIYYSFVVEFFIFIYYLDDYLWHQFI